MNCVHRPLCSCCLRGDPGIELIPHPWSLLMFLCGQKVRMLSKVNSISRQVVALYNLGGVSLVKAPIRGRLNLGTGNE